METVIPSAPAATLTPSEPAQPAPRTIYRDHGEEVEALLAQWRKDRSAVNGDEGGEAVR